MLSVAQLNFYKCVALKNARCARLKGTVCPKKNLYYSFDREENLHTYVKWRIKGGNNHELFSIFSIENELFKENVKKGGPL